MRFFTVAAGIMAVFCVPLTGQTDETSETASSPPNSSISQAAANATPMRSAQTASSAIDFPEPLGSKARSANSANPPSPKRKQAMQAYLKGVDAARNNHDYAAAIRAFRRALSYEASSTALFAAAQCRRVLNRPIEALFTYASALSEDSRMPEGDRLPEQYVQVTKKHMNSLMNQFVPVRVVLPQGGELDEMLVRGFPVVETDFQGQLKKPILLAGVRSRWIEKRAPVFSNEFTVYMLPSLYDIQFTLTDGRQLTLKKRLISPKSASIDFNRESLPAKIVVENVQPGTHIVVKSENDTTIVDEEFPELSKSFTVEGLSQGNYDFQASRRGFNDFDESYIISSGQEERVYLDLTPKKSAPLIKSWQLWLGVGVVAVAAIVTTAVVVANKNDTPSEPDQGGVGVIRFSLTNH